MAPPNPYAPPGAGGYADPYGPPPGAVYGAPGGYPPGYGAAGYPPGFYPTRTNGLAIASLVLGLAGWIVCGIGSVVAVVLGFVARSQIRASQGRETGDGMAKAGIILGFVWIGLLVAYLVLVAILASSSGSST
jgi:hypothetical protein